MSLTDEQKKELKEKIINIAETDYEDMMDAKANVEAELKSIKEQFGIEPKFSRKLVKMLYDSSADEYLAEQEIINELIEGVCK